MEPTKETRGFAATWAEALPRLAEPFPEKYVQKASGRTTGKGYDVTSWQYQAIVDRLNNVLGPHRWSFEVVRETRRDTTMGRGEKERDAFEITQLVRVTVNLGGIECVREMWGGHLSLTVTDAAKGATTNALKKCVAMIGCGGAAYLGEIDDDLENSAHVEYLKGRIANGVQALGLTDRRVREMSGGKPGLETMSASELADLLDKLMTMAKAARSKPSEEAPIAHDVAEPSPGVTANQEAGDGEPDDLDMDPSDLRGLWQETRERAESARLGDGHSVLLAVLGPDHPRPANQQEAKTEIRRLRPAIETVEVFWDHFARCRRAGLLRQLFEDGEGYKPASLQAAARGIQKMEAELGLNEPAQKGAVVV
ncbi:MAG: Rad52/Rad22 family DNA repair protein [Myxococcota bacterium]